jgi:DNA (cytosine-5)-methyltransferase 1
MSLIFPDRMREAARLHSYPDWFRFHATKWHGFRQIGNSVPPLLARSIAGALMRARQLSPTKPKKLLHLGEDEWLSLEMRHAADKFRVSRHTIPQRTRKLPAQEAGYI